MQVWMEHYFCYFSVRFGVIAVASLTMMQLLVPAIVFLSIGIQTFDPLIDLFENDEEFNKLPTIRSVFEFMKNDATKFLVLLNLYLFLHAAVCVVTIYAALKLLKWLLLPFILLEFMRVTFCFALHVVLMIVLKKIINLALLISFTLIGGFVILFFCYNWAASVALFQIFTLIRTARYQALYGEDPFAPPPQHNQAFAYEAPPRNDYIIENVRVLVTPNSDEITKQKRLNAPTKWTRRKRHGPPQVIPVIPAAEFRAQRQRIPTITGNLVNTDLSGGSKGQQNQHSSNYSFYENNNYIPSYDDWYGAELVVPGQRYQRLSNMGQNWRV